MCRLFVQTADKDGARHLEAFHYQQATDVAAAWASFFEPRGFGSLPDEIRYYCCAQFVVGRETIRSRPQSFYVEVAFIKDTD